MEKFHYEANGYNRSEVNAFIERVIRETEGIINKCQEQKNEIKDLKDKLESYKTLEDSINNFLNNLDDDKEIIDIKYQVSISMFSEEQIYCFSAMIIYT